MTTDVDDFVPGDIEANERQRAGEAGYFMPLRSSAHACRVGAFTLDELAKNASRSGAEILGEPIEPGGLGDTTSTKTAVQRPFPFDASRCTLMRTSFIAHETLPLR